MKETEPYSSSPHPEFLLKAQEWLFLLPYDIKILQEAVIDAELDLETRELAAGVLIHILGLKVTSSLELYLEQALSLRLTLQQIAQSPSSEDFVQRFPDVYESLDTDVSLVHESLGPDLKAHLLEKRASYLKVPFKGKRAAQYVEDEQAAAELYEEILDFQTEYPLTEDQIKNRLRRPEQILELLQKIWGVSSI